MYKLCRAMAGRNKKYFVVGEFSLPTIFNEILWSQTQHRMGKVDSIIFCYLPL